MKKYLVLAAAALALGIIPGAVVAKTYKAVGPKGGQGYSQAPFENGRHIVTYTGDNKMKREMVLAYAYRRAAEFTLESGYEWFAIISQVNRDVEAGSASDLAGKSGAFIGNPESSSSGTGAAGGTGRDSGVASGPSTGGFGGGDVPYQVLEKWTPRTVSQTILVIQMGKGDEASFPGVTKQPEIFDAKMTLEDINASMK